MLKFGDDALLDVFRTEVKKQLALDDTCTVNEDSRLADLGAS